MAEAAHQRAAPAGDGGGEAGAGASAAAPRSARSRGSGVRVLVAVVACAAAAAAVALGSAAWRRGTSRTALAGAADFNSISGKATIFWGEEDGMPGRYPPEYAAQLKKMRRLVKRVKMNNDR
jgi:hypothetical protein